jgi:hypothetical protein
MMQKSVSVLSKQVVFPSEFRGRTTFHEGTRLGNCLLLGPVTA